MGLFAAICLVIGNMVGSGIFLLPSAMANLGTISLYSWLFTTFGAIMVALVFVQFSRHISRSGGPYIYVRQELGDFWAFQSAYHYWLAAWVGNAAIAIATIGYLTPFIGGIHLPIYRTLGAIFLIWFFTFINLFGINTGARVQVVLTVLKLIPLLLVIFLGWHNVQAANYSHYYLPHNMSAYTAIASGATLTMWSFIGLESATVPSGHVTMSKRTVPIATIVGTLIVAVIYILSTVILMGMIPLPSLATSQYPFALAADKIFGHVGEYIIAAGAVIATVGCLNGWTIMQGQITQAIAEDRLFPLIFAKNNRHGVPAAGLIIAAILITLILLMTLSDDLVKQFQVIILMATLSGLIPYALTAIANIWFNHKLRESKARAAWYMLIAILATLYSVWAVLSAGIKLLEFELVLFVISIFFYILIRKYIKSGAHHAN